MMRIAFTETEKTSLEARFDLTHQGASVGALQFHGLMGSDEGQWEGAFLSWQLALDYERNALGALLPDADNLYNASVNGVPCGTARRNGGATAAGFSVKSLTLDLGGVHYECWPFTLGRKGYRYPVFRDGLQVAEFAKGCKVRDDLHSFGVAIADERDACAALLLCCYAFCQSWWKPGPAVRHHTHYYIQKKTRCGAPWPYDATFMDRIEE